MAGSSKILVKYSYTIRITVSSISLDTKYITAQFALFETDQAADLYRILLGEMRKHYQQHPKQLALHKLHDKRCLMHVF